MATPSRVTPAGVPDTGNLYRLFMNFKTKGAMMIDTVLAIIKTWMHIGIGLACMMAVFVSFSAVLSEYDKHLDRKEAEKERKRNERA